MSRRCLLTKLCGMKIIDEIENNNNDNNNMRDRERCGPKA